MGTRGAYGFRLDGKDKVTYNHFDSYPSYLGVNLVGELSERFAHGWAQPRTDPFDMYVAALTATVASIVLVQEDGIPELADVLRYERYADEAASGQDRRKEWYVLLRSCQGHLTPYLSGAVQHMIDSHAFLADSLFCEWAYVVNLDERTFEVYEGFNKDPNGDGRYASRSDCPPGAEQVLGVTLAAAYELPAILAPGFDLVHELSGRTRSEV